MATIQVHCPVCRGTEVIKYGIQPNGEQRYRCKNPDCLRSIFLLNYHDKGRAVDVKRQIVDMAMNGSGVRDTARVLDISPTTVIDVLKKKRPTWSR